AHSQQRQVSQSEEAGEPSHPPGRRGGRGSVARSLEMLFGHRTLSDAPGRHWLTRGWLEPPDCTAGMSASATGVLILVRWYAEDKAWATIIPRPDRTSSHKEGPCGPIRAWGAEGSTKARFMLTAC